MKTLSNLRAERLLFWAEKHRAVLAKLASDPGADPSQQYQRQLDSITKHIADAKAELGHNEPEPHGLRNKSGIVD